MNPVKKIMNELELEGRELTYGIITDGAFANLALHGGALLNRSAVATLITELVQLRHEVGKATEEEAEEAKVPRAFNQAGKVAEREQKITETLRERRKKKTKGVTPAKPAETTPPPQPKKRPRLIEASAPVPVLAGLARFPDAFTRSGP